MTSLLRGESTIAARLTALTFRNLVVILLTRGKLVTPEGFVFNILDLQGDRELTSIDFIPKQVPPDTMSALGLEAPVDPILDEANLLLAAVGGHWAIAAHAADLMTVGEADDAAAASIKTYIDALGSRLSLTVEEEMLHMRRLDDWASKLGDSSSAADLRGALQELWSQVVPEAETTTVSVREIADSRARLEGARNLAVLARSIVANLVLQPGR